MSERSEAGAGAAPVAEAPATLGVETGARGHLVIRLPAEAADVALATVVIDAAERDPRWSRISLIVPLESAALLVDDPELSLDSGGAEVVRVGTGREESAALERLRPDAILLLDHSFRSALTARRARVPLRAGLAVGWRRHLLTHGASPPTRAGRVWRSPVAHVARDLGGLFGIEPTSLHPRIEFSEVRAATTATRLVAEGLDEGASYWVVAPGAGEGDASLWPIERFAALVDRIAETQRWTAVLVGWRPEHEAVLRGIAEAASARTVVLALGMHELALLAPLAAAAKLWIGGQRSPAALPAAAGVACVVLPGPQARAARVPVSSFAAGLPGPPLECAPCDRERCPLFHARCATSTPVGAVAKLGLELFEEREAARLAGEAEDWEGGF